MQEANCLNAVFVVTLHDDPNVKSDAPDKARFVMLGISLAV